MWMVDRLWRWFPKSMAEIERRLYAEVDARTTTEIIAARDDGYLSGVKDAQSKVKHQKLEAEVAAWFRQEAAAGEISKLSVEARSKNEAILQEFATIRAPIYPTSDGETEEEMSRNVDRYYEQVAAYQQQAESVAQEQLAVRSDLDAAIVYAYKCHGMVAEAAAYEKHAFEMAEKLAFTGGDMPGIQKSQVVDRSQMEEDPYREPMYGPAGKKVSTVEPRL